MGNLLTGAITDFGWPEPCQPGNLVINELLFDPLPGGNDFIELYNASAKVLDLKGLKIANTDDNGMISEAVELSPGGYLLFPGTYIAFTTALSPLLMHYQPPLEANIQTVTTLPSWPDDAGSAVLLNSSLEELERFTYTSDMHFPLLNNKAGVSLERINPNRAVHDLHNWASATSAVHYATPGYKNSQYHLSNNVLNQVSVDPECFSPDQDGLDDYLNIRYQLPEPGFMANVLVFDHKGSMVRHLLKNELLSPEGIWLWNGLDDNAAKVPSGIYVVWVELFNLKGETMRYKLPCAAVYRF